MKKTIAVSLMLGLLLASSVLAPVAAATNDIERNETVYGTLDNQGQPISLQVVTWVRGETDKATWTDYGRYENLQSSVSDLAPELGNGTITWPASALSGEGLFYQGTTEANLPIGFAIDYYLDGARIAPEQLAGKSGQVKIRLRVSNQLKQQTELRYLDYEQKPARSQQLLYTPLMVQVGLALPVGTWSDVQATAANRVLVGNQLRLNFALFPYPNAEFTVQMQGQQISLAPFEISVLPMMPPLPDLDTAGQVKQLVAGVDQLTKSLQQLSQAASALASGQAKASSGGQQLVSGLNQLNQAIQAADAGAKSLHGGLNSLSASHQQLMQTSSQLLQSGDPTIQAIAAGLAAEGQALGQLTTGSQSLTAGLTQAAAGFAEIVGQTEGLFQAAGQIQTGQQALADGLQALISQGMGPMREQAVTQYAQVEIGLATKAAMQSFVDRHHSFVDNANNRIGQVQYLLRTRGVELPVVPQTSAPGEALKLSIWQRIVRLFTGK